MLSGIVASGKLLLARQFVGMGLGTVRPLPAFYRGIENILEINFQGLEIF